MTMSSKTIEHHKLVYTFKIDWNMYVLKPKQQQQQQKKFSFYEKDFL